jgi:DNA-binding transcriptional LysR family regulator
MRFNNGSAYITAGLAGLGIVSVPRAEASPHLQAGRLIEVLPGWELDSMPINLVYPYTRHLSARVRAFAEWAAALMDSHPLWTTK